jgi:hypothetical protein
MRRCKAGSAVTAGHRGIVTAGQYSPLHIFRTGDQEHAAPTASNKEQFAKLIANPGPLRVVYAKDYVDWYFRAYSERVRHQNAVEQRVSGNAVTAASADADVAGVHPQNGQPLVFRPPSSAFLQRGYADQEQAQRSIDEAAVQHGRFDLFERQPQFPALHIDRCRPHHIRELLDEHVISHEISADDVWRRALLYRGMLKAKRTSYPATYRYALELIDVCTFSFPEGSKPDRVDEKGVPVELIGAAATDRVPTLAAAEYYERLALRYHVENAVEAHVVLRCHQLPEADELLLSDPAPRQPEEINAVWASALKDGKPAQAPTELPKFPPLSALLDDPRNLPLATLLLFAELNTIVSTDPFAKFKYAGRALLRPTPTESRDLERSRTMTERIATARTTLLPASRMGQIVDSRAREFLRLQENHRQADADWFKGRSGTEGRFSRTTASKDLTGEAPTLAAATPAATYNPRAVRAELRDAASRRIMRGIRDFQRARTLTTRVANVGLYEENYRFVRPTSSNRQYRAAVYRPTPQHFLRMITSDAHVGLCLTMLRDRKAQLPTDVQSRMSVSKRAGAVGPDAPQTGDALAQLLRRRCDDLASLLYTTALEYHIEAERRVQLQAVKIAAALVDAAVADATTVLEALHPPQGGLQIDSPLATLRDPFTPFADRALDRYGFPSPARVEDYRRWVAAPAAP